MKLMIDVIIPIFFVMVGFFFGSICDNCIHDEVCSLEDNHEELNDVRQELLNRPDQYITFKDLVERFDEVDAEFNHSPWNLLQIYTNFNILIGEESEE